MAEIQSQPSDESGATTHCSESQPVAPIIPSDCIKHVYLNNDMITTFTERQGDKTDSNSESKSVQEEESEQYTLNCQQIGSRETTPAVGTAAKRGHSPSVAPKLDNYDRDEKQDQSKEEPSLEFRQNEGWFAKIWEYRSYQPLDILIVSIFFMNATEIKHCIHF